MNWILLLASMLMQAKAQADAEEKGQNQIRLADERRAGEQDKINELMRKNLTQYQGANELQSQSDIIEQKLAPAISAIDSTTNFQDVNRFGAKGSVKNNAFSEALTGAIADVAQRAKTKAGMLAKVAAPNIMRRDQAFANADVMQRQGIIGGNAVNWYNNVSKREIESAFKPNSMLMVLSQALNAYAMSGGGKGKVATTPTIVDMSYKLDPNYYLPMTGSPTVPKNYAGLPDIF